MGGGGEGGRRGAGVGEGAVYTVCLLTYLDRQLGLQKTNYIKHTKY